MLFIFHAPERATDSSSALAESPLSRRAERF
jgi:hypothetical protein